MAEVPSTTSTELALAKKASGDAWLAHMQQLFNDAKNRHGDVVWESGENDSSDEEAEEIWGHKAIVYSRAPPSFQARYFNFNPAHPSLSSSDSVASSLSSLLLSPVDPSHRSPPSPSTESFSLPSFHSAPTLGPDGRRSPSLLGVDSTSPTSTSSGDQILRLRTNINPALFSNELDYLYTGTGLGCAFEFLFDSEEKDSTDEAWSRVDKLRKDLMYMWRSRLYADVRIAISLAGQDTTGVESRDAVFSSHRFILISRSEYFRSCLQSSNLTRPGDQLEVRLPSPPFTPAAIHFTLGWIYNGTLASSHRTFDLNTAFQIFRSATYLQLDSLYREIEARVVEEMMHGLFYAFLPFDQYEKVTAGRWGVGGCKCKQCRRRAPRVLEFAMSLDIKSSILERGARRALSNLFGEGWCSAEFAALPIKIRANIAKGVTLRINAVNAISLVVAAQTALTKLESRQEPWVEETREIVLTVRRRIDERMCSSCEEVFEQEEWVSILECDGAHFGDSEKVTWVMESLLRGLSDETAGLVYQTLVSAILLRPGPAIDSPLLPARSILRTAVEKTRLDVVQWIGKKNRWQSVHIAGGFETMESWAIKEISDEIDVPVDALLAARPDKDPGRGDGDARARVVSTASTARRRPKKTEAGPSLHSIRKISVSAPIPASAPIVVATTASSNHNAADSETPIQDTRPTSSAGVNPSKSPLPTATPAKAPATHPESEQLSPGSVKSTEAATIRAPSTAPTAGAPTMPSDFATRRSSEIANTILSAPSPTLSPLLNVQEIPDIPDLPDSPPFIASRIPLPPSASSEQTTSSLIGSLGDTNATVRDLTVRAAPRDPETPTSSGPLDEAARALILESLLASLSGYSIELSDLDIDSKSFLGRGGYGTVRIGRLKSPSGIKTVAVKRLTHDEITISRVAPRLAREMEIWSKFKHPNVLDFIGFHFSGDTGVALLICPYLPLGNINDYVRSHYPKDKDRLKLVADAGVGLEYLHDLDVCHGDIKAANVLVEEVSSGPKAVLCDFGLAKAMDSDPTGLTTSQGFKGSIRWCAPEIMLDEPRSKPSDIWAFGCLFPETMKGKVPYHDTRNEMAVITQIIQYTPPASKADLPYGLDDIAQQCWKAQATERASIKDCLSQLQAIIATF